MYMYTKQFLSLKHLEGQNRTFHSEILSYTVGYTDNHIFWSDGVLTSFLHVFKKLSNPLAYYDQFVQFFGIKKLICY